MRGSAELDGTVLLHDATPLARYPGGVELLSRLAAAARRPDEAPYGLWLVCPMDDPRSPPRLDAAIVGCAGRERTTGRATRLGQRRCQECFVIDRKALLTDLKVQVRRLEDDLRERAGEVEEFDTELRAEWQAARDAKRIAATYESWLDERVTQSAVAWVLGTVFVRFCEDNGLIDLPVPRRAGRTAGDRGRTAAGVLREAGEPREDRPGVDRGGLHSPVGCVGGRGRAVRPRPQPDVADHPVAGRRQGAASRSGERAATTARSSTISPTTRWNTRFLGDLYQDLSEARRRRRTRCCKPRSSSRSSSST